MKLLYIAKRHTITSKNRIIQQNRAYERIKC